MKKEYLYVVGGLIVVAALVGGYLGRHQVKSLLMGTSNTASPMVSEAPMATSTPEPMTTASPQASGNTSVIMLKSDTTKGPYFTDGKGMTLYVFDKDKKGVSNCSGKCLTIWPPFLSDSTAKLATPDGLGTIKGTDGSMQYTYKGWPLYYYASDKQPGDVLGDGVGGVWHLAKP